MELKKTTYSKKARLLLWGVILWIALTYLPMLQGGFTFDDRGLIVQNPTIQRLSSLPRIFTQPYWQKENNEYLYRPLTTLTYAINWLLAGNRPWAFHLVNLLLHLANSYLAWLLLTRWGVSPFCRTLIVGLWGIHPVLTEAVAPIVGRADLLVFLFLILFLLTRRPGLRLLWYLAGLLSKENALIFPLMAWAEDLYFHKLTFTRSLKKLLYLLSVPMAFIFFKVALFGTFYNPYAINPYSNPLVDAGFFTKLATLIALIGRYVWKILFPYHLAISYYAHAVPVVHTPLRGDFIAGLIILGLIILQGTKKISMRHYYLFAGIAFLPFSHLLSPIGVIMAERFLYIPLYFLLSGWIMAMLRKKSVSIVMVAVILLFSMRTTLRCLDYKDNLTLFRSAVKATPNNAMAHYNYAQALLDEGRLDEAMLHFRRAASLTPDDANIYKSMILLTQQRGMVEEALDIAEAFLHAHPDHRDILRIYLSMHPPVERRYEVMKSFFNRGKRSLALLKRFIHDALTLHQPCEPLKVVNDWLSLGLWDDESLKLSAYAAIVCGDDNLALDCLQRLIQETMTPEIAQEIILIAMKAGDKRGYTILETLQAGFPEHPIFACTLADLAHRLHDPVIKQYWLEICLAQPNLTEEQRSYFNDLRRK